MKRLLALLLAMAMVFAMAACGSAESAAESAALRKAPPPGAEASAAEPSGDVLKIGALLNTTGWFASVDYNNQIEMQTLCDYYNSKGGFDIGAPSTVGAGS